MAQEVTVTDELEMTSVSAFECSTSAASNSTSASATATQITDPRTDLDTPPKLFKYTAADDRALHDTEASSPFEESSCTAQDHLDEARSASSHAHRFPRPLAALQVALSKVVAAGVPASELQQAEQMLEEEVRKENRRAMLEQILSNSSSSNEELWSAIQQAKELQLLRPAWFCPSRRTAADKALDASLEAAQAAFELRNASCRPSSSNVESDEIISSSAICKRRWTTVPYPDSVETADLQMTLEPVEAFEASTSRLRCCHSRRTSQTEQCHVENDLTSVMDSNEEEDVRATSSRCCIRRKSQVAESWVHSSANPERLDPQAVLLDETAHVYRQRHWRPADSDFLLNFQDSARGALARAVAAESLDLLQVSVEQALDAQLGEAEVDPATKVLEHGLRSSLEVQRLHEAMLETTSRSQASTASGDTAQESSAGSDIDDTEGSNLHSFPLMTQRCSRRAITTSAEPIQASEEIGQDAGNYPQSSFSDCNRVHAVSTLGADDDITNSQQNQAFKARTALAQSADDMDISSISIAVRKAEDAGLCGVELESSRKLLKYLLRNSSSTLTSASSQQAPVHKRRCHDPASDASTTELEHIDDAFKPSQNYRFCNRRASSTSQTEQLQDNASQEEELGDQNKEAEVPSSWTTHIWKRSAGTGTQIAEIIDQTEPSLSSAQEDWSTTRSLIHCCPVRQGSAQRDRSLDAVQEHPSGDSDATVSYDKDLVTDSSDLSDRLAMKQEARLALLTAVETEDLASLKHALVRAEEALLAEPEKRPTQNVLDCMLRSRLLAQASDEAAGLASLRTETSPAEVHDDFRDCKIYHTGEESASLSSSSALGTSSSSLEEGTASFPMESFPGVHSLAASLKCCARRPAVNDVPIVDGNELPEDDPAHDSSTRCSRRSSASVRSTASDNDVLSAESLQIASSWRWWYSRRISDEVGPNGVSESEETPSMSAGYCQWCPKRGIDLPTSVDDGFGSEVDEERSFLNFFEHCPRRSQSNNSATENDMGIYALQSKGHEEERARSSICEAAANENVALLQQALAGAEQLGLFEAELAPAMDLLNHLLCSKLKEHAFQADIAATGLVADPVPASHTDADKLIEVASSNLASICCARRSSPAEAIESSMFGEDVQVSKDVEDEAHADAGKLFYFDFKKIVPKWQSLTSLSQDLPLDDADLSKGGKPDIIQDRSSSQSSTLANDLRTDTEQQSHGEAKRFLPLLIQNSCPHRQTSGCLVEEGKGVEGLQRPAVETDVNLGDQVADFKLRVVIGRCSKRSQQNPANSFAETATSQKEEQSGNEDINNGELSQQSLSQASPVIIPKSKQTLHVSPVEHAAAIEGLHQAVEAESISLLKLALGHAEHIGVSNDESKQAQIVLEYLLASSREASAVPLNEATTQTNISEHSGLQESVFPQTVPLDSPESVPSIQLQTTEPFTEATHTSSTFLSCCKRKPSVENMTENQEPNDEKLLSEEDPPESSRRRLSCKRRQDSLLDGSTEETANELHSNSRRSFRRRLEEAGLFATSGESQQVRTDDAVCDGPNEASNVGFAYSVVCPQRQSGGSLLTEEETPDASSTVKDTDTVSPSLSHRLCGKRLSTEDAQITSAHLQADDSPNAELPQTDETFLTQGWCPRRLTCEDQSGTMVDDADLRTSEDQVSETGKTSSSCKFRRLPSSDAVPLTLLLESLPSTGNAQQEAARKALQVACDAEAADLLQVALLQAEQTGLCEAELTAARSILGYLQTCAVASNRLLTQTVEVSTTSMILEQTVCRAGESSSMASGILLGDESSRRTADCCKRRSSETSIPSVQAEAMDIASSDSGLLCKRRHTEEADLDQRAADSGTDVCGEDWSLLTRFRQRLSCRSNHPAGSAVDANTSLAEIKPAGDEEVPVLLQAAVTALCPPRRSAFSANLPVDCEKQIAARNSVVQAVAREDICAIQTALVHAQESGIGDVELHSASYLLACLLRSRLPAKTDIDRKTETPEDDSSQSTASHTLQSELEVSGEQTMNDSFRPPLSDINPEPPVEVGFSFSSFSRMQSVVSTVKRSLETSFARIQSRENIGPTVEREAREALESALEAEHIDQLQRAIGQSEQAQLCAQELLAAQDLVDHSLKSVLDDAKNSYVATTGNSEAQTDYVQLDLDRDANHEPHASKAVVSFVEEQSALLDLVNDSGTSIPLSSTSSAPQPSTFEMHDVDAGLADNTEGCFGVRSDVQADAELEDVDLATSLAEDVRRDTLESISSAGDGKHVFESRDFEKEPFNSEEVSLHSPESGHLSKHNLESEDVRESLRKFDEPNYILEPEDVSRHDVETERISEQNLGSEEVSKLYLEFEDIEEVTPETVNKVGHGLGSEVVTDYALELADNSGHNLEVEDVSRHALQIEDASRHNFESEDCRTHTLETEDVNADAIESVPLSSCVNDDELDRRAAQDETGNETDLLYAATDAESTDRANADYEIADYEKADQPSISYMDVVNLPDGSILQERHVVPASNDDDILSDAKDVNMAEVPALNVAVAPSDDMGTVSIEALSDVANCAEEAITSPAAAPDYDTTEGEDNEPDQNDAELEAALRQQRWTLARSSLAAAMALPVARRMEAMETAIEEALEAELPDDDTVLMKAKGVFEKLKQKERFREVLEQAIESKDEEALAACLSPRASHTFPEFASLEAKVEEVLAAVRQDRLRRELREAAAVADRRSGDERRATELASLLELAHNSLSADAQDVELINFAQYALIQVQRDAALRLAVSEALDRHDTPVLNNALLQAEADGLVDEAGDASGVLAAARAFLVALSADQQERQAVEDGLQQALASAQDGAEGLQQEELDAAAELLQTTRRENSQRCLSEACGEARSLPRLRQAHEAALKAGLQEADLETARAAIEAEEAKAAALTSLAAARRQRCMAFLQSALEQASASFLPEDLLLVYEARSLLTELYEEQQRSPEYWTSLLSSDPPSLSLEDLLGRLGDLLRLGLERDVLVSFVLQRIQSAEGLSTIVLAQSLENIRNEAEYFPGTLETITKAEIESAFYEGIERAAESEVSLLQSADRDSVILWLDATQPESPSKAKNHCRAGLPPRIPVLPDRIDCGSTGSGICISDLVPSALLCIELQCAAAEASSLQVTAFNSACDPVWKMTGKKDQLQLDSDGKLMASLCVGMSVPAVSSQPSRRLGTHSAKTSPKKVSHYLFIDLARVSPDACFVRVKAGKFNEISNGFVSVGELYSTSRKSFDLLFDQPRSRRESSTSPVSLAKLSKHKLAILPSEKVPLSFCLALKSDASSSKWSLYEPTPADLELDIGDGAEVVRSLNRRFSRFESMLTDSTNQHLLPCLRYWETYRALQKSGFKNIRCMATGVLWSTGKPGACEVALGNGFLKDLRALSDVQQKFRDDALPADDGFLALEQEHRRLTSSFEGPGSGSLLLRVARVAEMPIATIRGHRGWNETWLAAVDGSSTVGLPAYITGEEVASTESHDGDLTEPLPKRFKPVEEEVRQSFLRGRLGSTPQAAPQGCKWVLSSQPSAAGKFADMADPRHVLWIPGFSGCSQLLAAGLSAKQAACSLKQIQISSRTSSLEAVRKRKADDDAGPPQSRLKLHG